MAKRSVQTEDKYVVRLPQGMRDRIKASASANKRSMNAEIVARLEETYKETALQMDLLAVDPSKSGVKVEYGYSLDDEIDIIDAVSYYTHKLATAVQNLEFIRKVRGRG